MRIISVSTDELEYPERALKDIKEAIAEAGGLLAQTVGIAMCQVDFLETGFSSFVAEKLNFPIIGASASSAATDGSVNPFQFSLFIISSDTLEMRVGLTKSLVFSGENLSRAEIRRRIDRIYQSLYAEITDGLDGPADLIIPFLPPIQGYSDERVARVLFADHEEPFFGAFASDAYHIDRKSLPSIIYGGECYYDRVALLALKGNITPRFFQSEIKKANIARQNAIITRSEGNTLYEVNGRAAEEFLKSLGIMDTQLLVSLNVNPFILYDAVQEKYSPRVVYAVKRDGGFLFNGAMPEGATISVGKLEGAEITESAEKLFGEVASIPDLKGALFFSCLSKQLNLLWDELGEIRILAKAMQDRKVPWLFAYSGGEICPYPDPDREGEFYNNHTNLTTVALAL
jgi:hypothetical protein